MFGLITKRQLEQQREELLQEIERGRRDQEALKLEWLSMYDKFRMLLQRWVKRDKSSGAETPEVEVSQIGDKTERLYPMRGKPFPNSRRGF